MGTEISSEAQEQISGRGFGWLRPTSWSKML